MDENMDASWGGRQRDDTFRAAAPAVATIMTLPDATTVLGRPGQLASATLACQNC